MKNVFSTRSNYIKQYNPSTTPNPHPPPKNEERMNEKAEEKKSRKIEISEIT